MKRGIKEWLLLMLGQAMCPICGDVSIQGLCQQCLKELQDTFAHRQMKRRCRYCGQLLISETDICCECREKIESDCDDFPQGNALFDYRGIGEEAVRIFKFKNKRSFGIVFASFASLLLESRKDRYVLVPVPGNRSNVRKRGWDPASVIADALKVQGFFVAVLLERKRRSAALKRLNREERLRQADDCYRLRAGISVPRRVILIDDVRTTGSTVNCCARLLREAGAEEVRFLVIAAV